MDFRMALTEISELFGTSFAFKGFAVKLKDGTEYKISDAKELNITCGERGVMMTGVLGKIDFSWHMFIVGTMVKVWMDLSGAENLEVERIDAMIMETQAELTDRVNLKKFLYTDVCDITEIPDDGETESTAEFTTGIYSSNESADGISFITAIPMKFKSEYRLTRSSSRVRIVFSTHVPKTYESKSLLSEKTCIFNYVSLNYAIEEYWMHLHVNYRNHEFEKPIGWSSWDYYYSSVTLDDMIENMETIMSNDGLKEKVEYIAVDDGWQHREGDWYPNYRFPGGTKKLADEIISRGFKPGIWTAPTNMSPSCATVKRNNSFLIRNDIGDPVRINDMFIVDPTHPDGEAFIREIFTRLKSEGYAFYKIDFVNYLIRCDRFYDKQAGPFDAIRRLMTIIRECVGEESHIMGCSVSIGIGEGYVDSRRTGVDIHNFWSHVYMCTNTFAVMYAQHRKAYQNDVDYLVVRGNGTSLEEDPNVLDPNRNKNKDSKEISWCMGKLFNYDEAKTWCTLVLASGSSVFLGDRISALNEAGLSLVEKTVAKADFEAAVPVDLTSKDKLTVWRAENSGRIYIVNWEDEEKTVKVSTDKNYTDIFTRKEYRAENGFIEAVLKSHESAALEVRE